jgi:PAS domain S-box-containing protein
MPLLASGLWAQLHLATPLSIVVTFGILLVMIAAAYQSSQHIVHQVQNALTSKYNEQMDTLESVVLSALLVENTPGHTFDAARLTDLISTFKYSHDVTHISFRDTSDVATFSQSITVPLEAPLFFSRWCGLETINVNRPIIVDEVYYGLLSLSMSPHPIINQAWVRYLYLVRILSLCLAIILFSVWIVLRKSLRPLLSLAEASKALTEGDFAVRVAIAGSPELRTVILNFNRMASSIQSTLGTLQESESRSRIILQTAMDGFWLTDTHGRLLEVNETYCLMSGYTVQELLTFHVSDLEAVENGAETSAHLQRVMEKGEGRFETRHRRKDGTTYHVEVSVQYHPIEGGRLVAFLRDITERRKAEEELRFQGEIMNNMAEAVYLIRRGDGVIVYTNSVFERMFGYQHDEMLGRHVSIVNAPTDINPEETARNIMTVLDENGFWQGEVNNVRKDGTRFWCHANVSVFDHSKFGRVLVSVHSDITEQKRAEEALRKSEANLKRAMEISRLGAWEYDVDGYLFLFNDQFYSLLHTTAMHEGGYTMSSRHYAQLFVHPDDMGVVGAETKKAINTADPGYSRRLEHRIICRDSKIRTIYVHIRIIKDEHGRTVKTYGTNQDITELRRAEEENKRLQTKLQQAQKMEAIGTLAGGIAHDFNNILSAILGFEELVREDSLSGSVKTSDLDEVIHAGKRARDLVIQILAFSRQAEAKRIQLQPAELIKESIKLLRSSIPTTIDIRQDIDAETDLILADPTQIHQIIMNLCTNAFHAMEKTGGVLSISLKNKVLTRQDLAGVPDVQPGDFVQLSIGDTGSGIAPEIQERIFDPYFTTKETGKGTGMGLAIAHGIAKSYGGFITCHSERRGGTVFEISLPASSEMIIPETKKVGSVPGGTERILFIDDEEMLTKMGQTILERLGYTVTVRTNSFAALATFQNQPDSFDLVITDQTMPGMTGVDLAGKIL